MEKPCTRLKNCTGQDYKVLTVVPDKKVRKGFTKLRSVVNKVEPLVSSAAPTSRQEPSPEKRDWHKGQRESIQLHTMQRKPGVLLELIRSVPN